MSLLLTSALYYNNNPEILYVPQSGESNKKLAEQQNFKKLKVHSQPTWRFNNETQNSIYKVAQVI